jgi:hypothetical protein
MIKIITGLISVIGGRKGKLTGLSGYMNRGGRK